MLRKEFSEEMEKSWKIFCSSSQKFTPEQARKARPDMVSAPPSSSTQQMEQQDDSGQQKGLPHKDDSGQQEGLSEQVLKKSKKERPTHEQQLETAETEENGRAGKAKSKAKVAPSVKAGAIKTKKDYQQVMTAADGILQSIAQDPEFEWANNESMKVPLRRARDEVQHALSPFGRHFLSVEVAQIKKMFKEADSHMSKFSLDMDAKIQALSVQVNCLLQSHAGRMSVVKAARKRSTASLDVD